MNRGEGGEREQAGGNIGDQAKLTSTQTSSLVSASSLALLPPLTAWRLLGGAISSVLLTAGLLRSSILTRVESGATVGDVDEGIRKEGNESTTDAGNAWTRMCSREDGAR